MNVGAAVDFTGVTIPFSASDLLTSGAGLLGLVGSFVLLALAFAVVPKLILVIKGAFGNSK